MSLTAPFHTGEEATALLEGVDWDFQDVRSAERLHDLHPYPARFIPQIPRALLGMFPPAPGTVVLDPFCGSGTTLVEAVRAGHDAVGVDLNPIAGLIATVKTTAFDADLPSIANELVGAAQAAPVSVPEIPRLDHWFRRDIQEAVAPLAEAIEGVGDGPTRNALRLALSRILVRVSNQESDTRYAAVEKPVTKADVSRLFVESAQWIGDAVQAEHGTLFPPEASARVIVGDVLETSPDEIGPVGLIITSPPYPNAYEYWLYHKYRMYWLGWDPAEVKQREIGARPHFFGSNPQTEADFASQMERCFRLFEQVAVPGAKTCVVVGRSIIQGREIDNAEIIREAARPNGFVTLGTVARAIPTTRKAFNPRHGRIEKEEIVVLQRTDP